MEPQSDFADCDFCVFAELGREERADVGRDPPATVSDRARAEDGRAEEGR